MKIINSYISYKEFSTIKEKIFKLYIYIYMYTYFNSMKMYDW